VLVATIRALKYHGGIEVKDLGSENLQALKAGLVNLEKHIDNIRNHFGLPCLVAINHRSEDTPKEIELLKATAARHGAEVILAKHFAQGGKGAEELAHAVVKMCEQPSNFKFVYEDNAPLINKIKAIATKIYGASDVSADKKIFDRLAELEAQGYGHLPVCIAKTQYSFSTDPSLRGAPSGHVLGVREIRLAAGAEFIVAVCGDILTMPGLPKVPAADHIDLLESGKIAGLF
jgi:formate--tetrahydrofolate ligase